MSIEKSLAITPTEGLATKSANSVQLKLNCDVQNSCSSFIVKFKSCKFLSMLCCCDGCSSYGDGYAQYGW